MKLVGSYTSPFVRKLSILLLEKGITFEFINELPYNADNGVAQFNPLGKVPVLVTEEGECWFDSPIIAEYIELMNVAPAMLPDAPRDKCTLSCAINGIHAAFHYLKKNYISGCVMTVPTG